MRTAVAVATSALLGLSALPMAPPAAASLTCATTGTYTIATAADLTSLATVADCRSAGRTFVLLNEIDLSAATPWTPIGTSGSPFRGTFDGNGESIRGLVVTPNGTKSCSPGAPSGLFGVSDGATVRNLSLSATTSTAPSGWYVGSLIGSATGTTVTDIQVTATLNVAGDGIDSGLYVGGLIGQATGSTISNSSVSSESSVTGAAAVGGLVGSMVDTSITSSTSAASVVGTSVEDADIGGVVGRIESGELSEVTATGTVDGHTNVGGLIGFATGRYLITSSHARGNVNSDGDRTGGFVGRIVNPDASSAVRNSSASGSVTATRNSAGGFIGEAAGAAGLTTYITGSSSSGNVTSVNGDFVGGFAGYLYNATVQDSYSTGAVAGRTRVGSFVGLTTEIAVNLQRTYATGSTTSSRATYTGGFVGRDETVITVTDSVWNSQSSGLSGPLGTASSATTTLAGATDLTPNQMRFSSNFPVTWDFTTVWGYQCSTSVFPQLRSINVGATATSCPESTPDSGGGSSGTEMPPPTPASVMPAEQPPTVPVVPAVQSPGTSSMTIGAGTVTVNVNPAPRGQGLVLNAEGIGIGLRGVVSTGRGVPLSPSDVLVLPRSGTLSANISGLAPGSSVVQTLYSQPLVLGESEVTTQGSIASSVAIPSTVPIGSHTLRITGTTSTRESFTLDIGVTVVSPAMALGSDPILRAKQRGSAIEVVARAVQPRCSVTFTLGKAGDVTRASGAGVARAIVTRSPGRGWNRQVTARVSGKGCGPVEVSVPLA